MKLDQYFRALQLPHPKSHKGQNGKLLLIGGSELFHAASKWSLDVASKFVDMVFYSSVAENNQLVHEAKGAFWNGIVVPRLELENYLAEADCVLIGPGMERTAASTNKLPLTADEWEHSTERIVNYLLEKYPTKKWVIDAGALQMVDPTLLTKNCILTPHEQELGGLISRLHPSVAHTPGTQVLAQLSTPTTPAELGRLLPQLSKLLDGATLLVKGPVDCVGNDQGVQEVDGGTAGMTKGGTGDVLAGLVAALYCTHDAFTAAVVGSAVNKRAGELLTEVVGPYFNASDLVAAIPQALWNELKRSGVRE